MTTGKFKIKIDKEITEIDFMEQCLNLYHSGYDPSLLIGIYGLGKGLHVSKIIYLKELMGEIR